MNLNPFGFVPPFVPPQEGEQNPEVPCSAVEASGLASEQLPCEQVAVPVLPPASQEIPVSRTQDDIASQSGAPLGF